MTPRDWTLVVLAGAEGRPMEPVQLQKALFLIGKLSRRDLQCDPYYEFTPYDYGPFCRQVYADAEALERMGYVSIQRPPITRYKLYSATEEGINRARSLSAESTEVARDYVAKVVNFVQHTSFDRLVQAIYKKYPEMAQNSVFRQ